MVWQTGQNITLLDFVGFIQPYGGSTAPTGWFLCDGQEVSRTTYSDLFAVIGIDFGPGNGSTTFNVPDLRSSVPVGMGQKTVSFTFNAASSVDPATDLITVESNEFLYTGRQVTLAGASLPTGLSAGTYYVIRVSATSIKLATSIANANAGTAVDITADGSGTATLTITFSNRAIGDAGGEETHALSDAEMPSHSHSLPGVLPGTPDSDDDSMARGGATSTEYTSTGGVGSDTPHNNMPPFVGLNYIIKY